MDYHALRMRHARGRVAEWLRRWGTWLALLAGLLALGSGAPLAQLAGLPVLLALPLFTAAAHGPAMLALAVLAYAVAGALPVWLTRPLWWPARWAEAERALPLAPSELAASDRRCVRWGWLPLQALLALGVVILLVQDPPELRAGRAWAALAWLAAAWLGARFSRAALGHWRREQWTSPLRRGAGRAAPRVATRASVRPTPAVWPLLVWPLQRGAAPRSAHALALWLMVACAPAAALLRWPQAAGWWLAAATLMATAGTAQRRRRLWDDLAPLWAACAALPLITPPARAARLLALVPAVLALALALIALPTAARALPVGCWLVLTALAMHRATALPGPRPDHDAAFALLPVALAFAAASEVMP